MKFTKNKKRIDPRYFLNETVEEGLGEPPLPGFSKLNMDPYNNPFVGRVNPECIARVADSARGETKVYNTNNGVIVAIDENGTVNVTMGRNYERGLATMREFGYNERLDLSVPFSSGPDTC